MENSQKSLEKIIERIKNGERLKRGENLSFLIEMPLEELKEGAGEIQKYYCGNKVDLCTIINGRSGKCSEDCKYCAQASCHKTGVEEYKFMEPEKILENGLENEKAGVNRFSIVTSGRALEGKEFEKALETYRLLKKNLKIEICASHGILSREQLRKLKEAGVKNYHHNIETSKRYFPKICTSHSYEDRIKTIKLAQEEGLNVCSGGIIGLGEEWEDRLEMAQELENLKIKSIPINVLIPIKGTALENQKMLREEEIYRTIAIFRFINPEANIRLAAGRRLLPEKGARAFKYGASASITGDMLTTSGTTIKEDLLILKKLGMRNK